MLLRKLVGTASLSIPVLFVASAYADTINNPGGVSFTSNSDSRILAPAGDTIWTNVGGVELLSGAIDSGGNMAFDQADISFGVNTDSNQFTAQLQATSDATGTFCPNSGAATITFSGRIKITQWAGNPIPTQPCYLVINNGAPFTLTTGTSGGLTGAGFKSSNPKFVATVSLGGASGSFCQSIPAAQISNYYGTPGTATIELFDADVSPTLTGTGC